MRKINFLLLFVFIPSILYADGFLAEEVIGTWVFNNFEDAHIEMTLSDENICSYIWELNDYSRSFDGTWQWMDGAVLIDLPDGDWLSNVHTSRIYRVDYYGNYEGIMLVDVWALSPSEMYIGYRLKILDE